MQLATPNTHLTADIFLPKLIICAGEDTHELQAAIRSATAEQPKLVLSYRSYTFWTVSDVLIAWTGIGTGCIEPLLKEYAKVGSPERITLIGTSGLINQDEIKLGDVFRISEAYCRSNAVNTLGVAPDQAMRPVTTDPIGNAAIMASTDFYYPQEAAAPIDDADLVDMETAQFYFLCDQIRQDAHHDLEYVVFKGAANRLGHPEEQDVHGPGVLKDTAVLAMRWLSL